jgi:hypothetical protein
MILVNFRVAQMAYSSQVVLFGAEFTPVYPKDRSFLLESKENAVRITRKQHTRHQTRSRQSLPT